MQTVTKLSKKTMAVKFQSNDKYLFNDILDKIRGLPNRKYNAQRRVWNVPISTPAIKQLLDWNFSIDKDLSTWYKKNKKSIQTKKAKKLNVSDKLMPFQKTGVQFIEDKGGRALIADEMGLGKTVQALEWLNQHPELRPAIVVCPASLKLNWKKEVLKWTDGTFIISIFKGKTPDYSNFIEKPDIAIINYDILHSHIEYMREIKPKVMILDEVHYIKNEKTKRAKAVRKLAKDVDHILCLSGTPITNKPIEFFSTLNLLDSYKWHSRWNFAQKYCGATHNGFGWDFSGATNIKELHKELTDTVMIRRLKKDVLKELPVKRRVVIPIEIDNRTEYNHASENLISWITENEGNQAGEKAKQAEVLVKFEKLKQLAVVGKMINVTNWIIDFLESKEKLVVGCTHQLTIDYLMGVFGDRAVRFDGRDGAIARNDAVDNFQQNPDIQLFVGNIKAAGVGITLTSSSNTCTIELGWSPGDHDQFEDRVHRIGQESNSVTAWYLVAENTIEDDLIEILDSKRQTLHKILEGENVDDESLLKVLLKKYKGV